MESLGAKIATLEAICSGPPPAKNVGEHFQISQITSTLLGMDATARRKVLLETLRSDAPSPVEVAVLRNPAFLTGLSTEEQAQFRLEWAHKRVPEKVAQLEIYRKINEHVERGGRLLLAYAQGLSNSELIETAEIRERRAKGLIAGLSAE